jgi:hypothetical protein
LGLFGLSFEIFVFLSLMIGGWVLQTSHKNHVKNLCVVEAQDGIGSADFELPVE